MYLPAAARHRLTCWATPIHNLSNAGVGTFSHIQFSPGLSSRALESTSRILSFDSCASVLLAIFEKYDCNVIGSQIAQWQITKGGNEVVVQHSLVAILRRLGQT